MCSERAMRPLPAWMLELVAAPTDMGGVETALASVTLNDTAIALTDAQQLVDILSELDPRESLDLDEVIQDTDISRERAVQLIRIVEGDDRADYWLSNPNVPNKEFCLELTACLLERLPDLYNI